MRDHAQGMLAYVKLAVLSQQKQQLLKRDKFLVLAGAAACRAGWPEVAERCRALVLENNPAHLLKNYPFFTEALRNPDFQQFLTTLERFCSYEKAEHLLSELGISPAVPEAHTSISIGQYALRLLSHDIPSETRKLP